MKFELTKEQEDKYFEWFKKHRCKFTENPLSTGAIGGRLTCSFTPTGLGLIIKIKCACGNELDVSDYDSW